MEIKIEKTDNEAQSCNKCIYRKDDKDGERYLHFLCRVTGFVTGSYPEYPDDREHVCEMFDCM